ncbi:S8 family serine peptidase [Mariniphaga sp.]|uniref:S8 family serine peptidase n=1 Tax=Mariniphaga sp. TaxID=1954475 RepID=UPI00356AA4DE
MKTFLQRLFVFVLMIGFIQACNEPLVEEQAMDEVELKSAQNGKISYIVVLNDEELNSELANLKGYEKRQQAAQKAAEKVMKRSGVTDGELVFVYGTAIKGFSVKIPPGQLKKLQDDPSVKYIEEDQIITLIEPKAKPGDGDLQATATQETPWGITRVKGGTTYSGDKVVWVIDTGIDLDHEDLNVDGSRGWNFIRNNSNADDDNGHGSHCAGTIAAIDNAVGVVGVAAGATVIPVKVLDRRGSGSTSGVIAGVNWVAANGSAGDVANMSLGGGAYDPLDEAVFNASQKGIYFSLAAGNESDDANNHSPARVNGDYIFTISAMDINDNWAYFSNYGNPPVDYCEPGYNIYSTYKGGGYATMSGTSMAAPHMAGILVWFDGVGEIATEGTVNGDQDDNPDPIGVVGETSSKTGTLSGFVTNITTGSAISGATITIGSLSKTTGIDGSYTINNVPVGNDYSVTASADGYTSETAEGVVISENLTTTKNFSLSEVVIETYTVSGTVKDSESNPISGTLVVIENTNLSKTTGADGTYSISGVEAGIYNITASAEGYVSQTLNNISVNSDVQNVNFNLGETPVSSIYLQATLRKVRGVRYVDFVWSGAAGTQVNIKMNGTVQETVTNNGEYTIDYGRLSGTCVFQVCETDDSACSNEVTLAL